MIRLLVCDGDGTLGLPTPTPEHLALISQLASAGIPYAVASNGSPRPETFTALGFPAPAVIATPSRVRAKKPSPAFIDYISKKTGIARHEMAFLGDDDNTDTFCALNAGVLPLTAIYSAAKKPQAYGIPMKNPQDTLRWVTSFGQCPEPNFGWILNHSSRAGNVDVRSLLYQHTKVAGLEALLKQNRDRVLNEEEGLRLGSLMLNYTVAQIYLSGLASEMDAITVYPSSKVGKKNPVLERYMTLLPKVFKMYGSGNGYVPDLLVRHKDAPTSHQIAREARHPFNQLSTVLVNPEHRDHIVGRHIVVVDDYTTGGHSFEAARILLTMAGARKVTGVAFGKFRNGHDVVSVRHTWDPFAPSPIAKKDIRMVSVSGTSYPQVDAHFFDAVYPLYGGR